MEHISIDEAESFGFGAGVDHRTLNDDLGCRDVSINRYRIDPDGSLPWGLHAHYDQEEIFIVIEGSVTFETLDGRVTVAAGEAIRFDHGEYQSAGNKGDDRAVYLAIGAPPESTDMRIPLTCDECGESELQLGDGFEELHCLSCEHSIPAACQECGSNERYVHLSSDGSMLLDSCRACGDSRTIRSIG